MPWIELHAGIQRHHKTLMLAAKLGCNVIEALGIRAHLYAWAIESRPSGRIEREILRFACGAVENGDNATIERALLDSGLVDPVDDRWVQIHDWQEYTKGYRKAQKDLERWKTKNPSRESSASLAQDKREISGDRTRPRPDLDQDQDTHTSNAESQPLAKAIVSGLPEAGKPVDALKSTGTATDTSDAVCVDSRPVSGLPTLSQGEKVEALPITRRLVDIWNEGRKAQVKVTTVKIKRISTRLKDGWTEADLAKAIRNLKRSAWHMGQNDRGWVADWEFLFRNSEQVEKWVNFDLARSFDKAIMRERDPHAPPKL